MVHLRVWLYPCIVSVFGLDRVRRRAGKKGNRDGLESLLATTWTPLRVRVAQDPFRLGVQRETY